MNMFGGEGTFVSNLVMRIGMSLIEQAGQIHIRLTQNRVLINWHYYHVRLYLIPSLQRSSTPHPAIWLYRTSISRIQPRQLYASLQTASTVGTHSRLANHFLHPLYRSLDNGSNTASKSKAGYGFQYNSSGFHHSCSTTSSRGTLEWRTNGK